MQGKIKIKIDGQDLTVEEGFTILEASRQAGIEIPTLCFDEALEPYAACRLCVVELSTKGTKRLVASCVYPVEEGAEIRTMTDEILRHRKILVELYLSRSPNAKRMRQLAEQIGVGEPRYRFEETHNCVVCGMCVRACDEIVGASAIGFSQRGMKRKVEPPFHRGSAACISCGTCTTICPTEAITLKEIDQIKSVHVKDEGASLEPCGVCAAFELVPVSPEAYTGWLSEKLSLKPAVKSKA
jgi:NADH dehydrogenase/NADH:ubiquinone oxidoreductase subunit G